MNNINLLDCTLRDGGHVNKANFGYNNIKGIVELLNASGIEIIELGFLRDLKDGYDPNVSNFNKIEQVYDFIPKNPKSEFSLMIRPDWYDISYLSENKGIINFIRFAFYYKDLELTKKYCAIARDLGYKFFLNPVNLAGYTKNELCSLIDEVNEINPYALTIVDTFGVLENDSLEDIYSFIDSRLNQDIAIDLHTHENLNLSFSLMKHFLKIKNEKRKVFLDASLFGMGRPPGNLALEAAMSDFNKYDLEPVLKAINDYILPLKKEYNWGYHPAYFLSAKLKLHRSYAQYLIEKNFSLDSIKKVLEEIKENKNIFSEKTVLEAIEKIKGEQDGK